MIPFKNVIISSDLISKEFVCNITKCKGKCCVAGDAGAPLEKDEVPVLKKNYSKIKPFLSQRGVKAIEKQGVSIKRNNGDIETPLVDGKECAYTIFSDEGIAACGIEKAYSNGVIDFQKPISCHLYPVRVKYHKKMISVNYHKWSICSDACDLGKSLKIPIYQFVKKALIRKFGEDWFEDLNREAKKRNI